MAKGKNTDKVESKQVGKIKGKVKGKMVVVKKRGEKPYFVQTIITNIKPGQAQSKKKQQQRGLSTKN